MDWIVVSSFDTRISNFTDFIIESGEIILSSRIKISIILSNGEVLTDFVADFNRHLDIGKLTQKGRNNEKYMIDRWLWALPTDQGFHRIINAVLNRIHAFWWIALDRRRTVSPKWSHVREDTVLLYADLTDSDLDNEDDFDEEPK